MLNVEMYFGQQLFIHLRPPLKVSIGRQTWTQQFGIGQVRRLRANNVVLIGRFLLTSGHAEIAPYRVLSSCREW